ncbi:MAG: T9SS type A sorting domain-containing protein, partial [Ferruginibacter sp.]
VTMPVNSFSTFYIHGGTVAILPLRLLSFTAQRKNAHAELNWRTDNEVNTSHFVIEKSFTGAAYTAIGNIPSANTAGVHDYRFTDQSPGKGIIFYRLKQVDINGNYKYSETRTVYFSDDLVIKVYPTITSSVVTIYGITKAVVYTLYDMNGRALMNGTAATGNKEINMSGYSPGVYFLKITDTGRNSELFKIMKK